MFSEAQPSIELNEQVYYFYVWGLGGVRGGVGEEKGVQGLFSLYSYIENFKNLLV